MPVIKSAIKRNKQAAVRNLRNQAVKTAIRKDVRQVTDAMAAGEAKQVVELFRAAVSEIDRGVKKGVLHPNTAARKKSRLNALIKKTLGEATKPTKVTKTAKPAATAKPKTTAAKTPAKKLAAKKPAAKATKTTKK